MELNRRKQVAARRQMDCCARNARRQMRNKTRGTIECDHCQCVFYQRKQRDEHMRVHECSECKEMAVGDDERIHRIKHRQESQLERLQKQRQRKMDDDFVLGYVKANRLNEYRSQLDYEPDIDYIVFNYRFEKDEWLSFVKKFKRPFLKLFFGSFKDSWESIKQNQHDYLIEQTNPEMFSYLLEHRALSVLDAMDFLNILIHTVGYDDYVSVIVSYLLDNGCKIKAEWVAKAMVDDGLIERIKEKQTLTFGDVHKARKWHSFSPYDANGLKTFYTQLQKHFFNPDFENPFDDLHDGDFNRAQTKPIRVRQQNRFCYNRAKDYLTMVVGSGVFQETHSLGSIMKLAKKRLHELVKEYIKQMKVYDELDERVNVLTAERDRKMDRCRKEEYNQLCTYYFHELERYAEPDRDEQGDVVSKLYFVLSVKRT